MNEVNLVGQLKLKKMVLFYHIKDIDQLLTLQELLGILYEEITRRLIVSKHYKITVNTRNN